MFYFSCLKHDHSKRPPLSTNTQKAINILSKEKDAVSTGWAYLEQKTSCP